MSTMETVPAPPTPDPPLTFRLEGTTFRAGLTSLALVLVLSSCRAADQTPAARVDTPRVAQLAVPGRANEHVSLAARGSHVVAVWAAMDTATSTTDIYSAVSQDQGRTFAAPVRVNSTPGDARASGEQPPRVSLAAVESGVADIVVLWIARRSSGTVLLTARSSDGGLTFGPTGLVPGTDTVGNRGWQAMATGPSGKVYGVWLDHRRMSSPSAAAPAGHRHHDAAATTTAASAAAPDGVAMAQQSDLYFGRLDSPGSSGAITSGVCYCCKTAMASTADGAVFVAWRHVYAGNMRDIAFTSSRDGGRTFAPPTRVSEDHWSIAGCPDDGPSMAVDAGGRVHLVWPTAVDVDGTMTKRLFHSMTADGTTFTPRVAIPSEGAAHHPQIAVATDGSLIVVWDETATDERRVAKARGVVDATGAVSFQREPGSGRTGRYPAVVATGTGVLTAWIEGQGPAAVVRYE
jgi:hypothetical protein